MSCSKTCLNGPQNLSPHTLLPGFGVFYPQKIWAGLLTSVVANLNNAEAVSYSDFISSLTGSLALFDWREIISKLWLQHFSQKALLCPQGCKWRSPSSNRLQTVVLFDLALEVAAFRSRALQEDFWTSSSFISTQPETKWMQTKWASNHFFLTALFTSCFCRKITFGKTTARINIALHLQKKSRRGIVSHLPTFT